ncbi:type II secretion system protein GspD [Sphaerotilus mobilis]|uniref:Type II/III secretion system protein n=1 Tax=Sphaerotilus mobilis TaxID=47994 RepID=A0A4Q7LK31_9BURK|nr:secretin N-terminal domain-containing protein [Sphaerotilus mobilis]RZS54482.1 type II/III secretion system protein [Sphaerotilus mobilis]
MKSPARSPLPHRSIGLALLLLLGPAGALVTAHAQGMPGSAVPVQDGETLWQTPPGAATLAPEVAARPITLRLRDVPLRTALEALAQAAGVRFLPDPELKLDVRATLFIEGSSFADALDVLLTSQQLALRALDGRTLLVYPDTPARRRLHAELQTRRWSLDHVDAAAMASTLKTMLRTSASVTLDKGNALVLRDTPEALALAERLIAAHDRPIDDVVVDVQLIEVSRQQLSQLGIAWPSQLVLAPPEGLATLGDLRASRSDGWRFTPLVWTANLKLQELPGEVVAQPSVRARHKEKATLLVGDKVPVITNQVTQQGGSGEVAAGGATGDAGGAAGNAGGAAGNANANANANTGGGGNLLITGSVQYLDVGLKLEVEPQLFGDGDIGLKLALEISRIRSTLTTASGQAYQLATRQAQTSMRLRDGQTQWFGGLIDQQDRETIAGLPGLSQMPVAGRLFGSHGSDRGQTELLMAVTPRRVKSAGAPRASAMAIDSGEDARLRTRPLGQTIDTTDGRAIVVDTTGKAGIGAVGRLPDPATVAPMVGDMPGLPAQMPRPEPGRRPRGSAPPEGGATN